jgi:hypothetical protein
MRTFEGGFLPPFYGQRKTSLDFHILHDCEGAFQSAFQANSCKRIPLVGIYVNTKVLNKVEGWVGPQLLEENWQFRCYSFFHQTLQPFD